MKDSSDNQNRKLLFIVIYCILLFSVLIAINIVEFKLEEHPLELKSYNSAPDLAQKLLTNINTADLHQLCELPQIGETLAQRIIDYRNENGRFSDIDQIKQVKGIGEHTFNEIKDLITVD